MAKEQTIETAVLDAVASLVQAFQKNPYGFLYESDLQAELFADLRGRVGDTFEVKGSGKPRDTYKLRLVYSEYRPGNEPIDIACLDAKTAQSSEPKPHKGADTYIYDFPVAIGIELKYRKMGDEFGMAACIADFDKLKRLQVARPLVLGFLQNPSDETTFFAGTGRSWSREEVTAVTDFGRVYVIAPDENKEKIWVCAPIRP